MCLRSFPSKIQGGVCLISVPQMAGLSGFVLRLEPSLKRVASKRQTPGVNSLVYGLEQPQCDVTGVDRAWAIRKASQGFAKLGHLCEKTDFSGTADPDQKSFPKTTTKPSWTPPMNWVESSGPSTH